MQGKKITWLFINKASLDGRERCVCACACWATKKKTILVRCAKCLINIIILLCQYVSWLVFASFYHVILLDSIVNRRTTVATTNEKPQANTFLHLFFILILYRIIFSKRRIKLVNDSMKSTSFVWVYKWHPTHSFTLTLITHIQSCHNKHRTKRRKKKVEMWIVIMTTKSCIAPNAIN